MEGNGGNEKWREFQDLRQNARNTYGRLISVAPMMDWGDGLQIPFSDQQLERCGAGMRCAIGGLLEVKPFS